jgi:hypothetical protein
MLKMKLDADRYSKKIDKIHLLKAKTETFDAVLDSNKIEKIHLLKTKNENIDADRDSNKKRQNS